MWLWSRESWSKWAATEWELVEQAEDRALLFLHLLTGRKNQIRVHMADIGHPVVGDGKYGHQDDPGSRMCLHAFRLAFHHPVTGEALEFETPIPRFFGTALHHKSLFNVLTCRFVRTGERRWGLHKACHRLVRLISHRVVGATS